MLWKIMMTFLFIYFFVLFYTPNDETTDENLNNVQTSNEMNF